MKNKVKYLVGFIMVLTSIVLSGCNKNNQSLENQGGENKSSEVETKLNVNNNKTNNTVTEKTGSVSKEDVIKTGEKIQKMLNEEDSEIDDSGFNSLK